MAICAHTFVSAIADGSFPTMVQPSNWNSGHTYSGGSHGSVLARDTVTGGASSSEGASWIQPAGAGSVLTSPSSSALPVWFNGTKYAAGQFNTTSASLANVTGLSVSVSSQRAYTFVAELFTTSSSGAGVKAAISGTATATSIVYEGLTYSAATIAAQTRGAALAATVGAVTAVTAAKISINGTIVVNAAGTLTVQFAQNSASANQSSVLVGSSFQVCQASS